MACAVRSECEVCAVLGVDLFTVDTPWGKAQSHQNLRQGITVCSTASHGGYFVPLDFLHNIPLAQQEWAAKWSGSRHWYEEDCCWAAVCLAFPDLFPDDALPYARSLVRDLVGK